MPGQGVWDPLYRKKRLHKEGVLVTGSACTSCCFARALRVLRKGPLRVLISCRAILLAPLSFSIHLIVPNPQILCPAPVDLPGRPGRSKLHPYPRPTSLP